MKININKNFSYNIFIKTFSLKLFLKTLLKEKDKIINLIKKEN